MQFGAECMVEIDLSDEFPIDSVAFGISGLLS